MVDWKQLGEQLTSKLTASGFQVASVDGEPDACNLVAQREDYVDNLFRIVMLTVYGDGSFHIRIDTKQGRSQMKAMGRSGYKPLKGFIEKLLMGCGCFVTGYTDVQRNMLRPNVDVIPDPTATTRIEFFGTFQAV